MAALQRSVFSRVIAVLKDPADLPSLAARLKDDKQVPAKVLNEKDYLKRQTGMLSQAIVWLGTFLGLIMGIVGLVVGIVGAALGLVGGIVGIIIAVVVLALIAVPIAILVAIF